MTTRRSLEPFWWTLFSAGGVVAALLVPIHILLHGIAAPLGWLGHEVTGYEPMRAMIAHPLIKMYLFVLIVLPFYHWAHRFRHVLYDLGLSALRLPVAVACYGAAIIGTAAALWILFLV